MDSWAHIVAYKSVIVIVLAPLLAGVLGMVALGVFFDSGVSVIVGKVLSVPVFLALLFGIGCVVAKAATNRVIRGLGFLESLQGAWAETRADLSRLSVVQCVKWILRRRRKPQSGR
jgi:hypothetical protein